MRKIDRNFCAWMMAGALAVGTLSGGWTAPAQVWAASEKKEEKQKTDEKAQEQQTEADAEGTVSPSDYVLQPQESYSYADMGLSFQLPEEHSEENGKQRGGYASGCRAYGGWQ